MKRALITGITGQDGSYLADLLLEKGYEVFGLVRRKSDRSYPRLAHLMDKIHLVDGDLGDQGSLVRVVSETEPDEVYNLGAMSYVGASWRQPELTGNVTGLGATRLLEAVRIVKKDAKFYQASSSEMFGKVVEEPQTEATPFYPRSPYGVAKLYAHWMTKNYGESYDMFACCGILFNHESPRRGLEFVTRKITDGVARIKAGLQKKLRLGTLDTRRDWGFAGDYVNAMWLMVQQEAPDDFVIGTGECHSVRDFFQRAIEAAGLEGTVDDYYERDERFIRPAEVNCLRADSAKARKVLGWVPAVSFEELVAMMVTEDLERYGIE